MLKHVAGYVFKPVPLRHKPEYVLMHAPEYGLKHVLSHGHMSEHMHYHPNGTCCSDELATAHY